MQQLDPSVLKKFTWTKFALNVPFSGNKVNCYRVTNLFVKFSNFNYNLERYAIVLWIWKGHE